MQVVQRVQSNYFQKERFQNFNFYLIISSDTREYTDQTNYPGNAARNRNYAKTAVMLRSMNEPNFTEKSVSEFQVRPTLKNN